MVLRRIVIVVVIGIIAVYIAVLAVVNTHIGEVNKMMKDATDSIRINDSFYHFKKKTD